MKITLGELRKVIRATITENYGDYPQWEDHFSHDRESGHEAQIEDILARLRAGESISAREVDALQSELSGERHAAGLKHSSGEF